MFDLSGLTALVTGDGQGVGRGVAAALATRGAAVAVNDILGERAREVCDELNLHRPGSAVAAPFDVTDLRSVLEAVRALPAIDILVNNAGVGGAEPMRVEQFRSMDPGSWEGPIRVNLHGVMNCCHAVVDPMCERGWGRIITISSGAGTAGTRIGVSPYAAGKGGGIAFTRTLALEVARDGVTANTLALGLMTNEADEIDSALARSIPVGRVGSPQDVGAACVWLASREAGWVTGQTIEINGGSITT